MCGPPDHQGQGQSPSVHWKNIQSCQFQVKILTLLMENHTFLFHVSSENLTLNYLRWCCIKSYHLFTGQYPILKWGIQYCSLQCMVSYVTDRAGWKKWSISVNFVVCNQTFGRPNRSYARLRNMLKSHPQASFSRHFLRPSFSSWCFHVGILFIIAALGISSR